ncbi:MAG: DUF2946 family protein [Pseudolabrys sp.]|jgi:hypothetical protein
MHWIRKNSRFGSWAAVFALALQLALSFGHIHAEDFQDRWSATAWSSQPNPNSPDDDDRGPGHDFCAICAALNLTSSSVLPAVAVLATPVDQPYSWAAVLRPADVSYRVHFIFQARAPPYSV